MRHLRLAVVVVVASLLACRSAPVRPTHPATPCEDAAVVFVHSNQMGTSYTLTYAGYQLDGVRVFGKRNPDGMFGWDREYAVLDRCVARGKHKVEALLQYQGSSDLIGYTFRAQSDYTFDAEPGMVTTVKIVTFDDDPNRPLPPGATRTGTVPSRIKTTPGVKYDVQRNADGARFQPPADASVTNADQQADGGS